MLLIIYNSNLYYYSGHCLSRDYFVFLFCHLQIKSAPLLSDSHFKSALIDFGFLTAITKIHRRLCGNVGSVKQNPSHSGKGGARKMGSMLSIMAAFPQSFF